MSTAEVMTAAPVLSASKNAHLQVIIAHMNDAIFHHDVDRVRHIAREFPHTAFWRQLSLSYDNYSPMHYAASTGNVALVAALVEAGWALDVLDRERRTPLVWAAQHSHDDVCLELLESGAVPNIQDNVGETALHKAARCANAKTVVTLLENGCSPHVSNLTGEQPLIAAVASRNVDVVQALIRFGARVNAQDEEGDTALHWNARQYEPAKRAEAQLIHQCLINAGALPSILNNDEESALDLIAEEEAKALSV